MAGPRRPVWFVQGTHAVTSRVLAIPSCIAADTDVDPPELTMAVAHAGVNPTANRHAILDGVQEAIGDRRGYVDWADAHPLWLRPSPPTGRS